MISYKYFKLHAFFKVLLIVYMMFGLSEYVGKIEQKGLPPS